MKLMFKGKLWLHQMVLFVVLGVLVLTSVISGSFVFNLSLLWWLLGAIVGFLFVLLSSFFYIKNPSLKITNISLSQGFMSERYHPSILFVLLRATPMNFFISSEVATLRQRYLYFTPTKIPF